MIGDLEHTLNACSQGGRACLGNGGVRKSLSRQAKMAVTTA